MSDDRHRRQIFEDQTSDDAGVHRRHERQAERIRHEIEETDRLDVAIAELLAEGAERPVPRRR